MSHHTKDKGDLAAVIVIADLTKKGYSCFIPVVSEHLPFDIIAYLDGVSLRIQAKYSSGGKASGKTVWSDKNGAHVKSYGANDFDYYGLYLPDIDKVIYPSIKFAGCRFSTSVPNSATSFYWWEDFSTFTKEATKKTYKNFGVELTKRKYAITDKASAAFFKSRKVIRPSKDELNALLWEKPTIEIAKLFGVSDRAISKWAKSYGLAKPSRGYWSKLKAKTKKI